MRRIAILIACLAFASQASAIGISGNVTKQGGGVVWPCDILIVNRGNGQVVNLANDSTLANGNYALTLPNGRYDLTFKPKLGLHIFEITLTDQRVNNNTLVANVSLPLGKYVTGKVVGTNNVGVPTTDIRFKTAAGATPNNVQDNGTLADGSFVTLVDPGVWIMEVIPAAATHKAPIELQNVNLSSGDVALGNVVVQNGVLFTCVVSDAAFFPLANASIIAKTSVGRIKAFTPLNNTGANGVGTIMLPQGGGPYDITAEPPPATTFATASLYEMTPSADQTLPTFALQPGRQLTAHVVAAGTATAVAGCDIDVDKGVAPFLRIETPGDATDALGNFTVLVPTGTCRVIINPPVATKLMPLQIDDVVVGTVAKNLGTVGCKLGHWLDVHVVAQGSGLPIAGANIDVWNLRTHTKIITIDDVTLATGSTRIVIDTTLYNIQVSPPSAVYDTAHVIGVFHNLNDTAITIVMPLKGVTGVGASASAALELAAPWPNPAHAGMNFAFAGTGRGELEILDISGRRVATPWQGDLHGEQTARWQGSDDQGRGVPNGIYFARLRLGASSTVRRVVIAH